jgi:outer membrane protein, multidrug efflux system
MRKVAWLALVAGCSFAPKYERPAAPVPASFASATSGGTPAADLGWREVLGDPRLQRLVELALANNRDLRVAVLNVELAQAQYRIARAPLFPNVGASGAATFSGPLDGDPDPTAQYSVGIGVTAFELDLFGKIRNQRSAALESYFATEEARRSAHIALVAEVATQYLNERALDEQLVVAKQTLSAVEGSYEITRLRFEAGQRSDLDVRTAEAQVAAAKAEIARVGRLRALAANALALLVGQALPGDLPAPTPLEEQTVLDDIPAGLPSDLLTRRPDILAAEHELKRAHYDIGSARAAFFPTISLTAFAGLASTALSSLFSGDAAIWSFTPRVDMPLFTGGRNRANLDAAKVAKRIELARYERAIQVAFREVADALDSRAGLAEELEAVTARVAAEEKRFEVSELRYRTGIESYLVVLTAQRDLYAAQQQLIDVRRARLTNAISLYKALGGGWHDRRAAAR